MRKILLLTSCCAAAVCSAVTIDGPYRVVVPSKEPSGIATTLTEAAGALTNALRVINLPERWIR